MTGDTVKSLVLYEATSCPQALIRWGKIDLSVRSILCLICGTEQNRDGNADKNIEMVGMEHRHDLKRAGSDCKTVRSSELL